MTEFAKGGIIPPGSEPPLTRCFYDSTRDGVLVSPDAKPTAALAEALNRLRPAPNDTSWLAFEPAPRSLWARIRRLWHREGITKRESNRLNEAFLGARGKPPILLPADTIPLKDVARLDLKPGDTLVVTLAGNPSAKDAHEAKLRILAVLGDQIDEHHLLVVPETAKLSVMRQAGVAP